MTETAGTRVLGHNGRSPGPPESDDELIRACLTGEEHAWDRLVDRYQRLVLSIPLGYGLSTDDASDITQQCFTSLFQGLGEMAEDSQLGAWLVTVAKRNTWRLIRHRGNGGGNGGEVAVPDQSLVDREAFRVVERSELVDWLEFGLSQLDESCRDLITALYFDPRLGSYSQVAEALGLPLGSVGPMRSRCLERLREALEGMSDECAEHPRAALQRPGPTNGNGRPCGGC